MDKEWCDLLNLINSPLARPCADWWAEDTNTSDDTPLDVPDDLKNIIRVANASDDDMINAPIWQESKPKMKKKKKKKLRRHQWSVKSWNCNFKEWLDSIQKAFVDIASVHPLSTKMLKVDNQGSLLEDNDSLKYSELKCPSNGCCNRCRRKTFGQMNKRMKRTIPADKFAFYFCGCDPKVIGHCVRCVLVDYIVRAREEHGDFLVKDDDGNVIGLREISCYKKCGVNWSLASVFLLDGPDKQIK